MLTTKDLMQRALLHFPRWMDIRKRSNKSIGGQLLSSISEKTAEIQYAINEYIEQFFIPYYEDKCEEIPDFIYKSNIGKVNIDSLKILEPEYIITENINEFYNNNQIAYYQDGQIFIKDNIGKILYAVGEYANEATLEKTHVWNIYDEFATFVDIARFENETNRELYNRILAVANSTINSTEAGLKDAVIANLINIVPGLTQEDIVLERPTASNLTKTYETFGTILEYLANVNKDVMRTKSWDLDKWSNDFKQICYIPHEWDIALDEITNGIGDNDDLRPVFIDAINTTDLTLSFYEKSLASVDNYIMDNDMTETIELSLSKYSDSLNASDVNYSITASEATEIISTESSMPILVELYETVKGEHYRKIEEIITDETACHNINIEKNGKLEKGKYYKVRFTAKDKYSTMEIYKCHAINEFGFIYEDPDGTIYDFLNPDGNFVLSGSSLYNSLVKKSISKLTQCISSDNLKDIGTGIAIDKINSNANLFIDLEGCSGESLKIIHDCEMSSVLPQDIITTNFYYDAASNSYLSDVIGDEKNLSIDIMANEFSMRVTQGHCQVIAIINGKQEILPAIIENGEYIYSTERYHKPQKMNIIVTSINPAQQTIVSDIQYCNYEFMVNVTEGILQENPSEKDLYLLPNQYNNTLVITMSTKTQYSPVIRKIFVGQELDEFNAFESGLIKGEDDMRLVISSNCNVELYECDSPFQYCDKNDDNQKVTRNYSTDVVYKAISNDAYIMLDTSMYSTIESITSESGMCEAINTGDKQHFIIRLNNGQSVTGVTIVGHYHEVVAYNTIHELIKNEMPDYEPYISSESNFYWNEGYKLYANKALECFIVVDPYGNQKQVRISIDSFKLNNTDNISRAIVYNVQDNLETAFCSKSSVVGEFTTIGLIHEGTFDNFYIYPKNAKSYIARNEYTTYSSEKADIEIVNTFNNGYVDNKLMVYTIKSDNPDHQVTFEDGKDWSLNKKKITIKLNNDDDYNVVKKVVTDKVSLGSVISLKDYYTDENKEQVELAQYIINTDNCDYTVSYKQDITDISYDRAEFITVKDDRFNKLRYSNIAAIKYIGYEVYDVNNDDLEELNSDEYIFDNKKGILEWKPTSSVSSGDKIYILYSIKKPVSLKFNIDSLYKKVQYSIAAYNRIGRYKLKGLEQNTKIDLSNPLVGDLDLAINIANSYKKSDVVYTQCHETGFKAEKNGDILMVKKIAETNSLAVKSGWYYLLGKEYYMFATDQSSNQNIINDEFVSMKEISKVDSNLYFHKKTTNHIKNSKMVLGSLANSFNINDFDEIKTFKGASTINAITACNNYNYWHTFGMNISLVDGLNGLGFNFEPEHTAGYAILDITKYCPTNCHISFYNPNGLSMYIGKEKIIKDISLTDTICISTTAPITQTINDIDMATFKKEEGYKYYLIVRGQGRLDDIIIQDSDNADIELHVKNVTTLNLELEESIISGVVSRVMLDQEKKKSNTGEINSSGYIVNASNIDWNITKLKKYTSYEDWLTGWSLENVDVTKINDKDCAITTGSVAGKIETKPIYIGDPSNINSIVFKINDIPLASMKGFNTKLYQAKTKNGSYVPCKLKYNNTNNLNYSNNLAYSYIKLSVDIPSNKVIGDIEIYIEYKSTENSAPVERINTNGEYITEVLDTHYSANYKLKDIMIEDVIGDVSLSIRAAKEGAGMSVWSSWHEIEIKDGNINNEIVFDNYRFFQLKAKLSGKNSKIKIKHFDLEVIN